jgi:hypothetical protein
MSELLNYDFMIITHVININEVLAIYKTSSSYALYNYMFFTKVTKSFSTATHWFKWFKTLYSIDIVLTEWTLEFKLLVHMAIWHWKDLAFPCSMRHYLRGCIGRKSKEIPKNKKAENLKKSTKRFSNLIKDN